MGIYFAERRTCLHGRLPHADAVRRTIWRRLFGLLDRASGLWAFRCILQQGQQHGRWHSDIQPVVCAGSTPVQAVRTDAVLCPLQGRTIRQQLRQLRHQAHRKRLLQGILGSAQFRDKQSVRLFCLLCLVFIFFHSFHLLKFCHTLLYVSVDVYFLKRFCFKFLVYYSANCFAKQL